MFTQISIKKHKWQYFLILFLFLTMNLYSVPVFSQAATLAVTFDTNPLGGGPSPLVGLTMTASVSGTATGSINYYFYCNAANDASTTVIPGYAYSVIGNNSATITTPAGICDSVYANIGTYLAKVIVERGGLAAEERRTVGIFNPVPTVDIKARPSGSSDPWTDFTLDVPYNTSVDIRWTFTAVNSCTMSGDWSGTKTTPGQESTGNLTEGKTYIYTLECNSDAGMLTDSVMVRVAPPTLFINFSATPTSGMVPLTGVVLRTDVTGGTAVGTTNYTFYCDRSDSGTNITSGYNYKIDGTNSSSVQAPANTCDSIYVNARTYNAKVIVERGGVAVQSIVPITVTTPPPPVISFTADSTSLADNTSTTLRWTVNYATSCTPSGQWPSATPITLPTGNYSTGNLAGPGTYTYNLSCTGAGGTRSGSVSIIVAAPPAPIINITADSTSLAYNSSTTIRWTVSNATSPCAASNGTATWRSSTKTIPSGSESTGNLTGPGTYNYTLTCTGPGGTRSSNVSITVGSPPLRPSVEIIAQGWPIGAIVPYGTNVTLEWIVEGADTCDGTGGTGAWPGSKNPNGGSGGTGNLIGPDIYVYTITCTNAGGSSSSSITISVLPPPPDILSFTANPTTVNYNSPVQLTWESDFATGCTGDWPGASMLSTDGNMSSGNLTASRTFTITCVGQGGQDTATVSVNVNTPPTPTVSIQANPTSVNYGEASQLSWTSSNTTGCSITASGFSRTGLSSSGTGQSTGNLTASKVFTLICTGPGGQNSDTVTVSVGPAPVPTVTMGANPTNVDYNSSSQITWSSTNSTRCVASGDWSGSKSTSGTYTTPHLTREQSYAITCYNAANDSAYSGLTVSVGPAPEGTQTNQFIVFENPLQQNNISDILTSLTALIRMLAIGLAAIMIIVSGIMIVTAIDDREKVNKGKNMLKWSLIGLAIALAASFIIGLIQELIA